MEAQSRQYAQTVSCPKCGADHEVLVPSDRRDVRLVVRPYRGLVGDYTRETCAAGHPFFVYFC